MFKPILLYVGIAMLVIACAGALWLFDVFKAF